MTALLVAASVLAVLVIVLIVMIVCAPIGYQDENAFHFGRPPSRRFQRPQAHDQGSHARRPGEHASVRGAGQDRP
jgi:hypothetical protein